MAMRRAWPTTAGVRHLELRDIPLVPKEIEDVGVTDAEADLSRG